MSEKSPAQELSRRERQIMDAIYQRGQATAAEVRDDLPAAPSNSAVRALLAILVKKGHLQISPDGPRYVYKPTSPRNAAGRTAMRRVVDTFFRDSVESAVAALLDAQDVRLTPGEVVRLKTLIEQTRREGR